MIDAPQVLDVGAQHAAIIHLTIPRSEIQREMGPAMQEVMRVVGEQGATPVGPMFSHHHRMPSDVFDFDVGIPVAHPISASGRVQPGGLPAARIARTIYRGPYESLGAAWGEFNAWMRAAGHNAADDLWESYVAGPESGPDASAWQTRLNRPLR
jgi:effector-binding domain-containing protein